MLHAVIEVDFLAEVGVVVDFFFIEVDFVELLPELFQVTLEFVLVGLTCGSVYAVLGGFDAGLVEFLLFVDIAGTHTGNGILVVAVDINQCLEAVLLPCVKEPIDRPLLVAFAMVDVEVIEEVATDSLQRGAFALQSIIDELQVLPLVFLPKGGLEPDAETLHHIVLEVFIVTDGNDGIFVRLEGFIFGMVELATGHDKPRLIKRVTAKHASHGVGKEGFDHIGLGEDVVVALHGVGDIVLRIIDAGHGNILLRHLRAQFFGKAVDVDEDAVKFFIIGFQCGKTLVGGLLVGGVGICYIRQISVQWVRAC